MDGIETTIVNAVLLLVLACAFYRHHRQEKRIANLVRSLGLARASCEHIAAIAEDKHFQHWHLGEASAYQAAEEMAWRHLAKPRNAPLSTWSKSMARRILGKK